MGVATSRNSGMDIVPTLVVATGALTAISCSVSLTGIALIVYVKAYKHFLYRLTFHLVLASFMRAFFIGASAIPVDIARSNSTYIEQLPHTSGLCAFLGGARQYTYLWCAAAVMWTCLYVIKTGIRGYKQRGYDDILIDSKDNSWIRLIKWYKYEITGHFAVVSLPALVFWIPYIEDAYGLSGPWCWIHDYQGDIDGRGLLAFRIVFRLPVILGSITCVLLLSCILARQCRKALMQDDPWQLAAVKRVTPVMIYPITFALASVGSILHPILGNVVSVTGNTGTVYDAEMVFLTVFYLYDMSVTLSLFLHKEIRVSLSKKCERRKDMYDFYASYEDSSTDGIN